MDVFPVGRPITHTPPPVLPLKQQTKLMGILCIEQAVGPNKRVD